MGVDIVREKLRADRTIHDFMSFLSLSQFIVPQFNEKRFSIFPSDYDAIDITKAFPYQFQLSCVFPFSYFEMQICKLKGTARKILDAMLCVL